MALRLTFFRSHADSEIFALFQRQLSLGRGDFDMTGMGFDVGWAVTPRLEVAFALEGGTTADLESTFRTDVDPRGTSIQQKTSLSHVDFNAQMRVWLKPQARAVSRLAWIPRRVNAYVGAGAGVLYYELLQEGDFLDHETKAVFQDVFDSSGWTPSAHLGAGTHVRVRRKMFFIVDGRYLWAAAALHKPFVEFDQIDLSGFRLSLGVNWMF